MTTHIVAVSLNALNDIGERLKEMACEEECAFHISLLQCGNDIVGTIGLVVRSKHQANVLFAWVALLDAAFIIHILIGRGCIGLCPTLFLIIREWESERSRAVHRWLVC